MTRQRRKRGRRNLRVCENVSIFRREAPLYLQIETITSILAENVEKFAFTHVNVAGVKREKKNNCEKFLPFNYGNPFIYFVCRLKDSPFYFVRTSLIISFIIYDLFLLIRSFRLFVNSAFALTLLLFLIFRGQRRSEILFPQKPQSPFAASEEATFF